MCRAVPCRGVLCREYKTVLFVYHFFVDCQAPLGMEDGRITDAQITATGSHQSPGCSPQYARLNTAGSYLLFPSYAWCPKTTSDMEHLQVDFGSVKTVTKVATQGRNYNSQYVKTFSLSFSNDSTTWIDYKVNEQCGVMVCKIDFLVGWQDKGFPYIPNF